MAARQGFDDMQARITNMKSISAIAAKSAAEDRTASEAATQQLYTEQQAIAGLEVCGSNGSSHWLSSYATAARH